MTDNILTREEAAIAMLRGEKVEAGPEGHWVPAQVIDFKNLHTVFRRPPEPRRKAQEFWICLNVDGQPFICTANYVNAFRVREVLPGDVTLQRMTRTEAREAFYKAAPPSICVAIDHHVLWEVPDHVAEKLEMVWLGCCKHFGLIGEGS